ncbi:MAG: nitroreductase family protein [Pseudomonadales bacterium]|nr:nitroreductase family protein [Pseudomonadales bacterium]
MDLTKPVPREVIDECLQLAVQAPTGSNVQGWRWIVIDDSDTRAALAALYRRSAEGYLSAASEQASSGADAQTQRVFSSAMYLMEHLQEVPVHLIPCIQGNPPNGLAGAGFYASIYPAVWSFQLALRARGLGSCLTTLHLAHADEAAALLGIPDGITQTALLPVAYTVGTDFKLANRSPVSEITHWNSWG